MKLTFLEPYKKTIDASELTYLNKDDSFTIEYHTEAEKLAKDLARIDLEERKRIIDVLANEKDPKVFKLVVQNELEAINGMLEQLNE